MDREPVARYRSPRYPTREELPPPTRTPRRWQRNAAVLALVAAMAALGANAAPSEFWDKAGCCLNCLGYRVSTLTHGPQPMMGVVAASVPPTEGHVTAASNGAGEDE